MRDINLNAHYIVLFKNSRHADQVNCLARQIYPGNSQFLTSSYIKATKKTYGYLVINLHPKTPEAIRLRESFFPERERNLLYFSAKMTQRNMKKHYPFLKLLASSHPMQKRAFIKSAINAQIDSIREIYLNILNGNVSVDKKKLEKYKDLLRILSRKICSPQKKETIFVEPIRWISTRPHTGINICSSSIIAPIISKKLM